MLRLRHWHLIFLAVLALASAFPPAGAQGVCEGVAPVQHSGLKTITLVDAPTELSRLVLATSPPGDTDRLFIVGQDGRIWIHHRGDGPGVVTLFLDIRDRVFSLGNEQGLLGLAFDPDYATTGLFWVNYTQSDSPLFGPYYTQVSAFSVSDLDPDAADPSSEQQVLRFRQPESNHNGGQLLFGADGMLYVATGDGGGGGDNHGLCGNGQDTSTLLGKILRIDVRGLDPAPLAPDCSLGSANYGVPSDNPLADGGGGACDEIFSWGLRNPWRNDFDPLTGDFYVADVGQSCWEEVNVAPAAEVAGLNYGWRPMEGNHCFVDGSGDCDPAGVSCGTSPDCGDPSLVLPVLEYSHAEGCSITGGVVYRGCRLPGLAGRYFYGDYCSGWVRSFVYAGGGATDPQDHSAALDPGGTLAGTLSSFGRDARGEVYLVGQNGKLLKIMPLFTDLVVSAPGAGTPLLLGEDWTWEDLAFETEHPVDRYRVYRALRPGAGDFTCVHRTTGDTPVWVGGDPEDPPLGQAYAYLVTALSPDGEETDDGHPSVSRIPGGCP